MGNDNILKIEAPLSLPIEKMASFFHKSDEPLVRSLESLLRKKGAIFQNGASRELFWYPFFLSENVHHILQVTARYCPAQCSS